MDSHSRGNKRLPKGFPVQGELQEKNVSHILHTKPVSKIRKGRAVTRSFRPPDSYFIAGAYREPERSELIEQLILQREYIID
ncbi:MAG: hypothetical protein IH612_05540 [Desulfofustis sp.]|nr:hypothetical protein [Desulfofustis sp.]